MSWAGDPKMSIFVQGKKVYVEVGRGGGRGKKGSSHVHIVFECPLLSENIWVVPDVKKHLLVPL